MVVVFLVICTKRNSYKKGRKFVTELDGPDVTFQPVHPFQPEHPFQLVQWDHDVINLKEPVELDTSRVTIGSSVRSHDSNGVELLSCLARRAERSTEMVTLSPPTSHKKRTTSQVTNHVGLNLAHETHDVQVRRCDGICRARPSRQVMLADRILYLNRP